MSPASPRPGVGGTRRLDAPDRDAVGDVVGDVVGDAVGDAAGDAAGGPGGGVVGGRLGDAVGPPVLRRLSPRAAEVVAAARVLLERGGAEPFTMRELADELKIQAPSIYKHLSGKHAIEVALIESGLAEIGAVCHTAVRVASLDRAIAILLATYRRYSLDHPNLYRLATAGELPRADLTPGLEDWAGQPWWLVTGDPYLAQALWSFAHGMVILELDRRYPEGSQLELTWAAGAAAFNAACGRGGRAGSVS